MVSQLEIYDKNNVLLIRREVAVLKKRLEDCEKNHTKPSLLSPSPGDYGPCHHGHIVNISKPYIVQQNVLGVSYKSGGWGKDSLLGSDQSSFWVAPLSPDLRTMNSLYSYASYNDLQMYKFDKHTGLTSYTFGQGAGMIVYNKTMYYNCLNSRNLCKLSMNSSIHEKQVLNDAAFNNRFSYAATSWQDIDLAADEDGLWVIYSTEEKGGKLLISKLDATTLVVRQTWNTTLYKPGVTNAFMACGVFYATRTYDTKMEELFYMYDTNSGKEGHLSVIIEKMLGTMHSLSYNPNDHKLYMYDSGFLVMYDVTFAPKI